MPFVNIQSFNPANITISDVASNRDTGTVIIVTRPNSAAPAFLLMVTDAGELFVFDKTGGPVWTNSTGITGIVEASINQNGQVLIRVGNTITFFSATGVQVWQQLVKGADGRDVTVLNAKAGTSFVAVGAFEPAFASGNVQFRSLTDGSLIVEYMTDTSVVPVPPPAAAMAATADGATVYMAFVAGSHFVRSNKFTRTGGRVNVAQGTTTVIAGVAPTNFITAFTNQDGSINGYIDSGNAGAELGVLDGSLTYLGTDTAFTTSAAHGASINPNGTRIVVWRQGGTGVNALKFVTSSVFAVSDVVPAYTIPVNAFAADVSDEMLFFICDSGGQIVHVYNDSIVQTTTNTAHGVANMMVAVVRNV